MEIKTSAEVDKLFAALAEVHKVGLVVIQTNENKQTRSRYASLADVMNRIRPSLAAQGLWFTQSVGKLEVLGNDVGQWMTTRVCHSSGQWMEGSGVVLVPFIVTSSGSRLSVAWASGSAISYARRYTLCALLGIVTGDDDDAEEATKMAQPKSAPPPSSKPVIELGLVGEPAEYTGGRWREATGPDNRLLGDYSKDELKQLTLSAITEKLELPAVVGMLADNMSLRLTQLGEPLVPALTARGWDDWQDPNDWDLGQWHKALLTISKSTTAPKP